MVAAQQTYPSMNEILNILVVDDDDVDRMAVRRYLGRAHFLAEIVEAEDAARARDYLKRESFDCIFLDYRLPDIDGLTLVTELRTEGIYVPIIVLTGQGDDQTAVKLMKAGASDYLPKSRLSADNLDSLIRQAIRVYQAEHKTRLAQAQLRQTNVV